MIWRRFVERHVALVHVMRVCSGSSVGYMSVSVAAVVLAALSMTILASYVTTVLCKFVADLFIL